MTLDKLNEMLTEEITCYNNEAGTACSYCDDEFTSNALNASHKATEKALVAFKNDILAYLSQL